MNKSLVLFLLLFFFTTKLFAQTYSQYNTGTLFDSFENPSQRSFIPDSSRRYASNFFIPNIDGNFFLTGDAQQTIKNRYYNGYYKNDLLKIGPGNNYNNVNANANAYILMFKVFTDLNGNSELGVFVQTKGNFRGAFTDENIALLNGSASFPNSSYNNVLNSRYSYQLYGQGGLTYREQITKQFAFGIKLGYVTGIYDAKAQIDQSNIVFDKANDMATLQLGGVYRKTAKVNPIPIFNPGLTSSIGATYKTDDGFIIQTNVKDLGFIHWNHSMRIYNFPYSAKYTIDGLSTPEREANVYNTIIHAMHNNGSNTSYTTPLDGTAELSVSKLYWLSDDNTVSYSPTLIASKELFYNGFTGVLVNPVSYQNYTATVSMSYDNNKLFNLGGQLMIKSPNAEFFIGSDKLLQSGRLILADLGSQRQINEYGSFTGADIYVGVSFKFGPIIEHPMNASYIPINEDDNKGFLGRMWDKIFNPHAGSLQNN
ncbi:DUF5723 family protein [Mucilaginibacter sp. X5P1]|uniref:DUF5723 family protein n=1 Tax=Mucilaginibacter sp. X5P1 TaxID=2723088 RepID=UPI00160F38CC|nr:DUF5723 family protein [Mucilaginibacter sp. X5P1]MBB6141555.1 hypothetical protein [Mucilaginibacter sp. X5P1]